MELSKRLKAVASLADPGNKIADIGTDHAYIPIYLVQERLAPSAIAMDINEGPLERAGAHVKESGLENKIELRLSDGFENLKPFEADTAVLAGMGGGLMIRILKNHRKVTCSLKECILQPQSEIRKVRTFLLKEGFLFIQEDMVLEDGKYYPMMKVIPPSEDSSFFRGSGGRKEAESPETGNEWNETELRYGKLLLETKNPVLKQFLEKEHRNRIQILDGIEKRLEIAAKTEGSSEERLARRRIELKEELEYIQKGLAYYAVQRDY